MVNDSLKCGITYEKPVMQTADDERIINYEWPNIGSTHWRQ